MAVRDLASTGLPVMDELGFLIRRRKGVYPVYSLGYDENFDVVDRWLETLDGLVSLGRQGLFVHDNTHHTIEMGLAAGSCLNGLDWDREAWAGFREGFENHVVVD